MIKEKAADNIEAEAGGLMFCASCGVAEIDDVKLKECEGGCGLVQYCCDDCMWDHLHIHEEICQKRYAELREEMLFSQPESTHLGDCPLCFLPLPLEKKLSLKTCCGKVICKGCLHADATRKMEESGLVNLNCPFCRAKAPKTDEDCATNMRKRAEAKDPLALREIGSKHSVEGDRERAVKYWKQAAALGDAEAHYRLSMSYREGQGVAKDERMEMYHTEEAAIAGHPIARCTLACFEVEIGRYDRAVKHLIIGANLGHDDSLEGLKQCYIAEKVSKDDFAAALRAHQAAVDATKSPQRKIADEMNL